MIEALGITEESSTAGKILTSIIKKDWGMDGQYYSGFPIISSSEGNIKLDALVCTQEHGVAIIHTVNGKSLPTDFEDHVDDVHVNVTTKLSQLKNLVKKRKLLVPIVSITFAPSIAKGQYKDIQDDILLCRTEAELIEALRSEHWVNSDLYKATISRLQSMSSLKRNKKRHNVKTDSSRGAVLKQLEDELATLDVSQTNAVLSNVDGVQRIRGLAGSGKTVVLARKVAHIHSQNPEWKIAITFNSRSLKAQFERLITEFYYDANEEDPDWSKVQILHAWGSPKTEGLYYNACCVNNSQYYDYGQARSATPFDKEPFEFVCDSLLDDVPNPKPMYDVILIDEAQDFEPAFLRLCYEVLTPNKRLVYAYDELQNLGNSSMPSSDEIWGNDSDGTPKVEFKSKVQDQILDVCYRNPGPTLTAAHALGFGIYRSQMIQMFDYPDLWGEIGYETIEGTLQEGQEITLKRSEYSSPAILKGYNSVDEMIKMKGFTSNVKQAEWIAKQIRKNIEEDEILPSDIVVIHPNAKTLRAEVGELRNILFSMGINSSIAGVTASPDEFFSDNAITFTSIYRAKGNEAAMVYIMNAHYCNTEYELAKKRNILFTAMTRTKAWLRVCGIGRFFEELKEEYQQVVDNDFSLKFTYPTESERKKMRVVNRDMTSAEKNRVNAAKNSAEKLANLLDGEVNLEDIPEELRAALLAKLRGGL
ncbi:DEAD/DEAH box helicase [Vibrio splendidus]